MDLVVWAYARLWGRVGLGPVGGCSSRQVAKATRSYLAALLQSRTAGQLARGGTMGRLRGRLFTTHSGIISLPSRGYLARNPDPCGGPTPVRAGRVGSGPAHWAPLYPRKRRRSCSAAVARPRDISLCAKSGSLLLTGRRRCAPRSFVFQDSILAISSIRYRLGKSEIEGYEIPPSPRFGVEAPAHDGAESEWGHSCYQRRLRRAGKCSLRR